MFNVKKGFCILLAILIVIINVTMIVAFAEEGESLYEQRLRLNGFTEQDELELKAIMYLSDENVSAFVVYKYKELGDWKKVREYYKVDEKKYENYMLGKKLWQEKLDSIPNEILTEMEERKWTRSEISNFINRTSVAEINYKYAWDEIKKGRTLEDILEEKREKMTARSKLTNEFVYGDMTMEEYKQKLFQIFRRDEIEAYESIEQAEKLREQTRARHKRESGISDEEIEFCKSQGISNPMDMYQGKSIAVGNNLSFEDVIKTFIKVKSWSVTIVELMDDVTPESYIELIQDIIDGSTSEFDNLSQAEEKIREVEEFYGLNGKDKKLTPDAEIINTNNSNVPDISDFTALFVGSNKAYVRGVEKSIDADNVEISVFVEKDRAYVPIRFISENYGGKVEWIDETQTVNIVFNDREISLTIGKKEINVNGKVVAIDVAPVLENERTFLPLRACVDALDKEVFYSQELILISDSPVGLDETKDKNVINDIIQSCFK